MRYIKFLLLNIIIFATLLFFISVLFPGQVVTAKTVTINAPKEKVVEKIMQKDDWKNWNHFVTPIEIPVQASTDTINFIVANDTQLKLKSQFYLFNEQNNITTLNWALVQKLPWYQPWKKFSAMVINKPLATAMDTSLNIFKSQVESQK